jgi:hypothetical protein
MQVMPLALPVLTWQLVRNQLSESEREASEILLFTNA